MRKIGLVTIATLALGLTAAQAGPLDPHTIVVTGYAETLVKPDHATVNIGVVTSDQITTKALQANNVEMQRVVATIKALGIPDDAMQTSDFTINALHSKMKDGYTEDESVTLGYQVVNEISVSVSDLGKIADIIDTAVRAGANSSNSVSFETKNRAAIDDQTLADAVRNARHNAEVVASAEHVSVGKMVSMTNAHTYGDLVVNAIPAPTFAVVSGVSAPILPGQIKVTVGVVVTYAVK